MNLSLQYLSVHRLITGPFFQLSENHRVALVSIRATQLSSSFLLSRGSSQVCFSCFSFFLNLAIRFESIDYKNKLFTSLITISDTVSSIVSDCQFNNCHNRAILCDKTSSNLTIVRSGFYYCGVDNAYGGAINAKCSILLLERICFNRCYAKSNHCTAYFIVCSVKSDAIFICCLKCPDTESCWNHVAGIDCQTQNNSNHNYTENKLTVNAGLGIFKASKQSILQFIISNTHTAGGALCFFSMNLEGTHRYGNIIGNSLTKGTILMEKATSSISNFYFAGNSGSFGVRMGSGTLTFVNCIFDRSFTTSDLVCSTCINCVYSTNGIDMYKINRLNTGRCEGYESSSDIIEKTLYLRNLIRNPLDFALSFASFHFNLE